jgi:hypothetical protein
MIIPAIDFRAIREHEGTRAKGFEELCCQLALLEPRPADAIHTRKGAGADAGVECFTRFADGRETGWQAKYYWNMDGSLTSALDKSIESALDKHPDLDTYIVCVPFDLPDPRTGTKTKSALDCWENWKNKWIAKAASENRNLKIPLWSAVELRERLARDDGLYGGRLLFWFDIRYMNIEWFRAQFDKIKADLGSRYTAETNIALPIRRALLGLARDPALGRDVGRWMTSISDAASDFRHAMQSLGDQATTPALIGLQNALRELDRALLEPFPGPTS